MPLDGDRLAENSRLAAMVRFPGRTGGRARLGGASARLVRTSFRARRRVGGGGGRGGGEGGGGRDVALSLRHAAPHPQRRPRAGARHHGVHFAGDGRRVSDMAATSRFGARSRMSALFAGVFLLTGTQAPFLPVWLGLKGFGVEEIGWLLAAPRAMPTGAGGSSAN